MVCAYDLCGGACQVEHGVVDVSPTDGVVAPVRLGVRLRRERDVWSTLGLRDYPHGEREESKMFGFQKGLHIISMDSESVRKREERQEAGMACGQFPSGLSGHMVSVGASCQVEHGFVDVAPTDGVVAPVRLGVRLPRGRGREMLGLHRSQKLSSRILAKDRQREVEGDSMYGQFPSGLSVHIGSVGTPVRSSMASLMWPPLMAW